ncbi:MAG: FAD-dependent oxidoreductase [Bacteroides cellulosilyticus]
MKINVLNRDKNTQEEYRGKIFIDATYEGDLAAAAGVPFRVGREGKNEFGEPGAGSVYKYWHGPEMDASTFIGDNAVQAYNYRLCLTKNSDNKVPITKPQNYDRNEYASIIDDVWTGRHTQAEMVNVTLEMLEANKKHIAKGNPTMIPGDKWGLGKVVNLG